MIRCIATQAQRNTASPAGRRWRRYEPTVPVRITLKKSRQVSVINAWGFQINDGGLSVRVETELTIGDEGEFRFTPPHFYPVVRVRGVIRNRMGDVYGVEFLATNAAQQKQKDLFRQIVAQWDV